MNELFLYVLSIGILCIGMIAMAMFRIILTGIVKERKNQLHLETKGDSTK